MVLTIGLWTNKGGVGKTTLNFHLSTAYAHLNPGKRVVVVDMCPQANLSSTLLTDVNLRQETGPTLVREFKQTDPNLQAPRTVAGYLHRVLNPGLSARALPAPSQFLIKVDDHNPNVPDNMWLLCGDSRLETMNKKIAEAMSQGEDEYVDFFVLNLHRLREFFQMLEEEEGWRGQEIVVFIDTNPTFSEYTKMALATMDKLVIPVNADDFSRQAVDYMLSGIWNLFADNDVFQKSYNAGSFAVKAAATSQRPHNPVELRPRIAAIIHNRHNVYATKSVAAFQQLHQAAASRMYQAFTEARETQTPAFVSRGNPDFADFNRLYTATMREMFRTGVVSSYTGVPLHRLLALDPALSSQIRAAFSGNNVVGREATINLMADLLKVLSVIMDDFDFSSSGMDEQRLLASVGVANREELQRVLFWRMRTAALNRATTGQAGPEVDEDDLYPDLNDGTAARAFLLNDNSCGPDSAMIASALTLARAPGSSELLPGGWRLLAEETGALIQASAAHPMQRTSQQDASLERKQEEVLQWLQEQGLLPGWQPGEHSNLDDLLPALGLHTIHLTDDVLMERDPLLGPSKDTFEMQRCAAPSLSAINGNMPKWLVVAFRRTEEDYFSLRDECDTKVGPNLAASSIMTVEPSANDRSPITYELRSVFVTKGGHHTTYTQVAPAFGFLAAGWYHYDDRTGRIVPAGDGLYPIVPPDMSCSISCMLYMQQEEVPPDAEGCHRLRSEMHGCPPDAAGILRAAENGIRLDREHVLELLRRHEEWGLPTSTAVPHRPVVGSVYLFDTSKVKATKYKQDGHHYPPGNIKRKTYKGLVTSTAVTSGQHVKRYIYYIQPETKKGNKVVLVHYATPMQETHPSTTPKHKAPGGGAAPGSSQNKKPRPGDGTPQV